MSGTAHTDYEIIKCAGDVRTILSFEIEQPMVGDFLLRYVTHTAADQKTVHLAEYLLCLSALSYALLQHAPQAVAAAAVVLSHGALEKDSQHKAFPNWQQRLLQCAEVSIKGELIPCIEILADLHASVYTETSCLPGFKGKGRLSAPRHFHVAAVSPTRPFLRGMQASAPRATSRGSVSVPCTNSLLMHTADWTLQGSKRRSYM